MQGDGGEYQMARGIPAPKAPSREAQMRHNLTHLPYASWCPWCVMGRKCNAPHLRTRAGEDRNLPLFVLDYCFVRDEHDEKLAKVLVGKLYPYKKVFACVVDMKGTDGYAITRLVEFFRESGISKFVYKSDREPAIVALMEEAVKRSGRSGELLKPDEEPQQGVPENSAVGESASNGRAERTIQAVEDLLRVHKLALEGRLKARIPSDHAVLRWLVEHVADLLTKFTINPSGLSPYEELHGKKAKERRVEFGKRVFFHTPRKGRAKLSPRWRLGIYLGHASNSNESYLGLKNGNVIKARAMTRVVEGSRWCKDDVLQVTGSPGDMRPVDDGYLTEDEIETAEAPH